MAGVLFIGYLEEQRRGLEGEPVGVDVGGAGEAAETAVVEDAHLVEGDGHVGAQGRLRGGHDLTGQLVSLGELAPALEVVLEHLVIVVRVAQGLVDVEQVELVLGHAQLGIGAVLQHGQDRRHDDASRAALPQGILFVLDGDESADEIRKILVHLVVYLLLGHRYIVPAVTEIQVGLAVPFDPGLALLRFAVHPAKVRIVGHGVGVGCYALSGLDVFLISVPDGLQRIPAAGRVGVSQVQDLHVVASLLEEGAVKVEELALWVRHDH